MGYSPVSKKVATPKQTAGGGFAFEDKVVGYYLAWMLSGTSPLKAKGTIGRIDCQVFVDGWEGFDDLLITLSNKGHRHRCAFSLKSNPQFNKKSAPSSLVRSAWSLLLHLNSEIMDIERDGFGLICVPHPDPPKIAIQSILIKARGQTPTQLFERLPDSGYASDVERNIHNSCSCPSDLVPGLNKEQKLAGNLLKRLSVIELDFENADSSSEATALFLCSTLVADGAQVTAQNLWNALCQKAQSIRKAGGGISREELLSEIRSNIELKELPDFSEDWHHLEVWYEMEVSAIKDRIAGTTQINRDDLTAKIMSSLQETRFVSVVGASGTGKTVIAKRVSAEFRETGLVLWLKGERLRPGYVEALGSHHHLRHPLKEVIGNGKSQNGLIVLDSGERLLNEDDFNEICLFLHMLGIGRAGSVWRLLVICREESWDRVQLSLTHAFGQTMQWEPVNIDYPDYETLTSVWKEFPALRTLAVRPHLAQVMKNFKVLDLLANVIKAGRNPDARSWVGESDLIRWYWEQAVRSGQDGSQRSVLLCKLAEGYADSGRFETPETDLAPDNLTIVGNSSDLLCTDTERGVIFFAHDLIAEWSRFQVLLSHEQDLATYCADRFTNPRWHTALRLYGISLLEKENSGEKWKAAITNYPKARDCLLESLVFAGNSEGLVNSTWPVLQKGS